MGTWVCNLRRVSIVRRERFALRFKALYHFPPSVTDARGLFMKPHM